MKNLVRLTLLTLALVTLFVLVACGGETTTTETTTTEAITTEEVTVANVAVDGKTDYVIVYDDSNAVITKQVKTYVTKIRLLTGVDFQYKEISKVTTPYENEIIIGDLGDKRPVVNNVKANCTASDFAVSVQNGDIVMYATDDTNYQYLFATLFSENYFKPVDGELTVKKENDFYQHSSSLKDTAYVTYLKQSGSTFNMTVLETLLSKHTIKMEGGGTMAYRLYVPSNYDPNKEYPFAVVLHGHGGQGSDNVSQLGGSNGHVYELFNHEHSPYHDAIVIFPQCTSGSQWVDWPWANGSYSTKNVPESDDLKAVVKIMESVMKEYSVDESRVYATGLSMGGFGTWDLLMRHGNLFAAAVPICGGADPTMAAELAKIPIRTFHCSGDGVVPVSGTREIAAAIKECNPIDFEYVEINKNDHNAWTDVNTNIEVLEWMFAQKKGD